MKKKNLGYIAWPRTFAILQKQSSTTIEEVAMWIWNYPRDPRRDETTKNSGISAGSGIRAYTKIVCDSHVSREDNAKYRFSFDPFQAPKPGDISEHLCGLWFSEQEIKTFKPIDRYLTYDQVEAYWGIYNITDLTSFLRAQVHAGNLLDMHPVFGATQLSNADATHCPAAVEAIFLKAQIDLIASKELAGTAMNLRGSKSKAALCHELAKNIKLDNPNMTLRAIAFEIYKLDNQKDKSDPFKLELAPETIRRYMKDGRE